MSDFQSIVADISKQPGVAGAAVADSNGALLHTSIQNAADGLGGIASSVFSNIGVQLKRMQRGIVSQLVLETEGGITLLSGMKGGELLIVFANVGDSFNLAQLLEATANY